LTDPLPRLSAALADRYRIERELGEGGMATVYLAEGLKHDRKVALKVLKPELAAVIGAERFVVEIKTTAALQHPHILPLFDSGEADSFLYYVMPFIDGETLRSKLDRETQLGIEEAVGITTAVADALDYAHRHGVIHRDIKPENILLHDGRPMVADFGIALALSAAAGGRMTETGMSLGTPHYMSPEQATAEKEITARSDVYSLGSVLYEMLTGNPPHTGASAQQIIMKIVTEEAAPVTRLRKAVPTNVAAAVAKSLEKLPADRFDSARAFADALQDTHFTTASMADVARPATIAARRGLTIGLGAALAVMTLVAGWALLRPRPALPVSRYGLSLPPDQMPDPGGFAVLTPDGSRLVFLGPSDQGAGVSQLWVKRRDQVSATRLLGTDAATAAAVSPDGKWLAVVQADRLRKMPIEGGPFVPLAEGVSSVKGTVAWLDDDTILYVTADIRTIMRIPAAGGVLPTEVWSSDSMILAGLTPLPDGRGVLLQGCHAPCDTGNLMALDLRNDSMHQVTAGAKLGFYVNTGHLVYVRDNLSVLAVPFDLRTLHTQGAPVAVLDSISIAGGIGPYLAVSRAGTVVMRSADDLRNRQFEMVWVDRTGRQTVVDSGWTFRVTQFAGNFGWRLSPDGTRVAIGLNTPAGDDIWVKPLPRGPVARVTYGEASENRPRWRQDAQAITFVSTQGMMQKRADGTGTDSLLVAGSLDEGVVSPDNQWFLVRRGATSSAAGGRDIYGIRTGDTTMVPMVVTPYDEMSIEPSPDGKWLAYVSDETGRIEVFVRPFPNTDAGKVQVSNGGGLAPLWSRNGRELFYLASDRSLMAATVTTSPSLQIGEPHALFRIPESLAQLYPAYYTPWDVAPDGRFIMVRAVNQGAEVVAPLIVIENWLEELKAVVKK